LIFGVLISIKFGLYPILIPVAVLSLIFLWSRLKRPGVWRGNGFKIRVRRDFRDEGWVEYREGSRTLALRAIWAAERNGGLNVELDDPVYFPPDYTRPLSEPHKKEIERRRSKGLDHLRIRHRFIRVAQWGTDSQPQQPAS
jgi:hypothetical protein